MSLSAGTPLGPYEIVGLLGAGGMGEVYRARDSRLQREVAIKIVASGTATDADRLARFEQEARATAALNHPNIVGVFDIGQSEHGPYIVSELLDGEALRERLGRGRVPVRTALDIAVQVTRGLAAAHDRGIVHRDLKPDNIFITKDGHAKILDFGLAKLQETMPAIGHAETVATIQSPARTGPGLLLGTVGYMAPEQVRGEPADHRSDIFALGCVLYELLAGRRAFGGASHVETMNAILTIDPAEIGADGSAPISGSVDRVLRRCLEKDPGQRFQSSRDLAFALEAVADSRASSDLVASAAPRRTVSISRALPWAVALVMAAALAWSMRPTQPPPPPPRLVFSVRTPATLSGNQFALSPSGSLIVTTFTKDNIPHLWIEPLNGDPGALLAPTERASMPFFSGDGRWIGFFSQHDGLKRVNVEGGPAQRLAPVEDGLGGTANQDGVIVFAPGRSGPLFAVSENGGAVAPLTTLNAAREELAHSHPQFLPDGRHFIYLVTSAKPEHTGLYVASLDSPAGTFLVNTQLKGLVAAPGYLLFMRDATLMARPFDIERLALSGDEFQVYESVGGFVPNGAAGIAVAANGTLAVRRQFDQVVPRSLRWVTRDGRSTAAVPEVAEFSSLALSPDGRRVAVGKLVRNLFQPAADLWIIDLERGSQTRFTSDATHHDLGAWSHDGMVAYAKGQLGATSEIYVRDAGSIAPERRVATLGGGNARVTGWSPDGKSIVYEHNDRQDSSVVVLPLDDESKAAPVVDSPRFNELEGRISPDGRLLVYQSSESGRQEIYVVEFPVAKSRTAVSTNGGASPHWTQNGKEIVFQNGSEILAADVSVSKAGAFQASVPRRLATINGLADWDVTADGQRIIASVSEGETSLTNVQQPILIIQNWQPGSAIR
jgi:serine/threonine protein kinase/Tol biopolymer transport system component